VPISDPSARLPHLRLDDLLGELQARLEAMLGDFVVIEKEHPYCGRSRDSLAVRSVAALRVKRVVRDLPRQPRRLQRIDLPRRPARRHLPRGPRHRLRPLPQRPHRLDLTPDELTGETA
jgi:hypothetical protein